MNSQRLIGPAGALAELVFDGQVCREIPGHSGYWVPRSGAFIVSTRRVNKGHDGRPHLLKAEPDRDGYVTYSTIRKGGTALRMHTAVLLAWVGPRPDGLIAIHRDDCKTNNSWDNLEWGTHADNGADKRIFETAVGERNSQARMTENFVIRLREEAATKNLPQLCAAHPGFSRFAIWAAVTGYTWAHVPGARIAKRKCSKDAVRIRRPLALV